MWYVKPNYKPCRLSRGPSLLAAATASTKQALQSGFMARSAPHARRWHVRCVHRLQPPHFHAGDLAPLSQQRQMDGVARMASAAAGRPRVKGSVFGKIFTVKTLQNRSGPTLNTPAKHPKATAEQTNQASAASNNQRTHQLTPQSGSSPRGPTINPPKVVDREHVDAV